MPKFSVIIVSWNVAKSLRRCLDSIFALKYPELEVYVIDNASTDDSAKIAKSYSSVFLIQNTVNLGFPKAVNIGLRQCRGEFILLLNPDTRLPVNFFKSALEFFRKNPQASLMGPTLIDPDGTLQGSVFPEVSLLSIFKEFWLGQEGINSKYSPPTKQPLIVPAVSGACMVFPRQTIQKVGLLTEQVFMYYEDLDYCRRIRRSGGQVFYNPSIQVVHEHGQSAQKNPLTKDWRGTLWQSSLWYHGFFKHYLFWLVTASGQKIRSLFH